MDKLINLLANIDDTIDFTKEKNLIIDGKIESIDVVRIISLLEETYGIEIGYEYITKENFKNVEKIWDMLQKIKYGGK